jgi:uncharacterized membrane protein
MSAGPLPPAEQLEQYERVSPGSAKIIFDEFQKQSEHRRAMERIVVRSDSIRSFSGLFAGLLLGGYIVYVGAGLLRDGHSVTGFSAIGVAVAIAVGPFLVRNYLQSQERRAQQEALARLGH